MNGLNSKRLLPVISGLALGLLAGCNATGDENASAAANEETLAATPVAGEALPVVTVYKSPNCTCCAEWAEHLRENGLQVDVEDSGFDLAAIKAQNGVPEGLGSCHTSVAGPYVFEGHVPADLVVKVLSERPNLRGLAVPGMPPGVQGMPDPGPNRNLYQVLAIQPDGSSQVYATR